MQSLAKFSLLNETSNALKTWRSFSITYSDTFVPLEWRDCALILLFSSFWFFNFPQKLVLLQSVLVGSSLFGGFSKIRTEGRKYGFVFGWYHKKMSVSSGMWKSSWKDTFGFFQDAQIVNSNFIWVISGIDYRLAWKLEELASKFAIFTQSHFWWSSQTMTFFFSKKILLSILSGLSQSHYFSLCHTETQ